MKSVRCLILVLGFILVACGGGDSSAPGGSPSSYIGSWTWTLTAYDIDGGGTVGSGEFSVQNFSENPGRFEGKGAGSWANCEGWCSPDSGGAAEMFTYGPSLTLVLNGQTPAQQSLRDGWLNATRLVAAGADT